LSAKGELMVRSSFFRKKVILVILAIIIIAGIIAVIALLSAGSNRTPIKAVYVYQNSKACLRLFNLSII
jgi:hypothetical protein